MAATNRTTPSLVGDCGAHLGAEPDPLTGPCGRDASGDGASHAAAPGTAGAVVLTDRADGRDGAPTPIPATQAQVELIRFRVRMGRWPTMDDVEDRPDGAVLVGREWLNGSVFMPESIPEAWALWSDAEAERRHQEVLARLEAVEAAQAENARRWRDEYLPAFRAEHAAFIEALRAEP